MSITLKTSGIERTITRLQDIPSEIERTTESLLKQEARALAVDLAFTGTMPFGVGEPRKSRARIHNGVRRVYVSMEHPSRVYDFIKETDPQQAAVFWRYFKKNNTAGMRKIAQKFGIGYQGGAAAVKSARTGPKGEVPKDQKPLKLGPETTVENLAVKESMRAGLAKAGWIRAALSMGGRIRRGGGADGGTSEKVPEWLRKLSRDPALGTSTFSGEGTRQSVTLTNAVRYASDAVEPALMDVAISNARARFVKALAGSVKAIIARTMKRAA
jgi:hypothetical protein